MPPSSSTVEIAFTPPNLVERLVFIASFNSRTNRELDRTFRVFMVTAERNAKLHATGGNPLNVQTGRLINSITHEVERDAGGWLGSVGSNVVYAAIQEYGGVTRPHWIDPKRPGGVLAFEKDGATVFARSVWHPGSNLPPRPYIRPGIEEAVPAFVADVVDIYNRVFE